MDVSQELIDEHKHKLCLIKDEKPRLASITEDDLFF